MSDLPWSKYIKVNFSTINLQNFMDRFTFLNLVLGRCCPAIHKLVGDTHFQKYGCRRVTMGLQGCCCGLFKGNMFSSFSIRPRLNAVGITWSVWFMINTKERCSTKERCLATHLLKLEIVHVVNTSWYRFPNFQSSCLQNFIFHAYSFQRFLFPKSPSRFKCFHSPAFSQLI